jgi:hypothetical protein
MIVRLSGMAACVVLTALGPAPAMAQSANAVVAFDWRGDSMGWGPAFRPDSTYYEPGTPLTPGEIAGRAYRARTGHGVYDKVEGPAFDQRAYRAQRAYHHRHAARE